LKQNKELFLEKRRVREQEERRKMKEIKTFFIRSLRPPEYFMPNSAFIPKPVVLSLSNTHGGSAYIMLEKLCGNS